MKQLVQVLRTGAMMITSVPVPQCGPGRVLVRNAYSVISSGTEASTVKTARRSLLGKAKERPEQVKQVLTALKTNGPVATYRAVMKKLDAYSPLGYSCAGRVVGIGPGVRDVRSGDLVAVAGVGFANHAELVSVPINLAVKLPATADLKLAAYNTLGAIALQGIRQADLKLGETCAVIGLGLIGQLTCAMLRASGVHAVGIDIHRAPVEIARKHSADEAFLRSDPALDGCISQMTAGLGVDAIIIAAASSSLDPIDLAGHLARKRGRVVVVGAVPTGFDREPYYRKEIELRMSCSYGPGRYDPAYEEQGIDYPAAYVRWTERRNMAAFQDLVHRPRIDISFLTTHEFDFDDAPRAYDLILNRTEPFLGVVLKYPGDEPVSADPIIVRPPKAAGEIGIGFIGAGSYAQSSLIPHIPSDDKRLALRAVLTTSGTTSKRVAERFGFEISTSDERDLLDNRNINTIFIATRHDTHSSYIEKALAAGKHVFVEKPLATTPEQLEAVRRAYSTANSQLLVAGYNRRFAPLTTLLKQHFGHLPVSMIYRVNAGAIARESWIQDPNVGGGRIIGEVCHFIDLMMYISGSRPARVFASDMASPSSTEDTLVANLEFDNGSVGAICYFANGSRRIEKERLEVYSGGTTAVLSDFRELRIAGDGVSIRKTLWQQDKGQSRCVGSFLDAIRKGLPSPISFDDLYDVSRISFAIAESIRTRLPVSLS